MRVQINFFPRRGRGTVHSLLKRALQHPNMLAPALLKCCGSPWALMPFAMPPLGLVLFERMASCQLQSLEQQPCRHHYHTSCLNDSLHGTAPRIIAKQTRSLSNFASAKKKICHTIANLRQVHLQARVSSGRKKNSQYCPNLLASFHVCSVTRTCRISRIRGLSASQRGLSSTCSAGNILRKD